VDACAQLHGQGFRVFALARNVPGFADGDVNARKRFRDARVVPGAQLPVAAGAAADWQQRHAGTAGYGQRPGFEYTDRPARAVTKKGWRNAGTNGFERGAYGLAAGAAGGAAHDFRAVVFDYAGNELAFARGADQKAGLQA